MLFASFFTSYFSFSIFDQIKVISSTSFQRSANWAKASKKWVKHFSSLEWTCIKTHAISMLCHMIFDKTLKNSFNLKMIKDTSNNKWLGSVIRCHANHVYFKVESIFSMLQLNSWFLLYENKSMCLINEYLGGLEM